jgi:hypothetical protein
VQGSNGPADERLAAILTVDAAADSLLTPGGVAGLDQGAGLVLGRQAEGESGFVLDQLRASSL